MRMALRIMVWSAWHLVLAVPPEHAIDELPAHVKPRLPVALAMGLRRACLVIVALGNGIHAVLLRMRAAMGFPWQLRSRFSGNSSRTTPLDSCGRWHRGRWAVACSKETA